MAIEQYANKATSTLDGDIADDDTTLDVASASTFPTTGNFRILVGDELMIVTAVSSATFTVTRGAEGTTAAAHATTDGNGKPTAVTHIVTAASLKAVGEYIVLSHQVFS